MKILFQGQVVKSKLHLWVFLLQWWGKSCENNLQAFKNHLLDEILVKMAILKKLLTLFAYQLKIWLSSGWTFNSRSWFFVHFCSMASVTWFFVAGVDVKHSFWFALLIGFKRGIFISLDDIFPFILKSNWCSYYITVVVVGYWTDWL